MFGFFRLVAQNLQQYHCLLLAFIFNHSLRLDHSSGKLFIHLEGVHYFHVININHFCFLSQPKSTRGLTFYTSLTRCWTMLLTFTRWVLGFWLPDFDPDFLAHTIVRDFLFIDFPPVILHNWLWFESPRGVIKLNCISVTFGGCLNTTAEKHPAKLWFDI